MTHDQVHAIAVEAMHRISEQLHILDLYETPTESEVREFVTAVRRNVSAYQAAWSAYQDGATE